MRYLFRSGDFSLREAHPRKLSPNREARNSCKLKNHQNLRCTVDFSCIHDHKFRNFGLFVVLKFTYWRFPESKSLQTHDLGLYFDRLPLSVDVGFGAHDASGLLPPQQKTFIKDSQACCRESQPKLIAEPRWLVTSRGTVRISNLSKSGQ